MVANGGRTKPHGGNKFPTLEMMQPPAPPSSSTTRMPTETIDLEEAGEATEYVKGVQKIVNSFRKSEQKARKLEEERLDLEGRWKEYQKELQASFMKEGSKYRDRMEKLRKDTEDNQTYREERQQSMA